MKYGQTKKANCKMAVRTIDKLTYKLSFVVTKDFLVDQVYYDSKRSFPTDKEMDNLKLFIAEIRETVLEGEKGKTFESIKEEFREETE